MKKAQRSMRRQRQRDLTRERLRKPFIFCSFLYHQVRLKNTSHQPPSFSPQVNYLGKGQSGKSRQHGVPWYLLNSSSLRSSCFILHSFTHSFFHLFSLYVLRTFWLGIVMGCGGTSVNKIKSVPLLNVYSSEGARK